MLRRRQGCHVASQPIGSRQPAARQGVSVILLLAMWCVLIFCLAMVIDTAQLFFQGCQIQIACESAALAGAGELWDRTTLTPEGLQRWLASDGLAPPWPADAHAHTAAVAKTASRFAAANVVANQPVTLRLTESAEDGPDVLLGRVANPTRARQPMIVSEWPPQLPCNSVLVRNSRNRKRGNPMMLWLARQAGWSSIALTAAVRATLDQRVYGFRSTSPVRVPLLPLVVGPEIATSNERHSNSWLAQACRPIFNRQDDRFCVAPDSTNVTTGQDGIPELELTVSLNDEEALTGDTHLVALAGRTPRPGELASQIRHGYGPEDLPLGEGSITLDQALPLILRSKRAVTADVITALESCRGKKRIWLLSDSPAGEVCYARGFAAGQLVDLTVEHNHLSLVVQPCQLVTCTALTGPRGPANPWLGKVLRTE